MVPAVTGKLLFCWCKSIKTRSARHVWVFFSGEKYLKIKERSAIKLMEQDRAESIGTQNEAKAITAQDYQVLRLMREMDYGHLVITVKGGQPVHAEVQKSVQIK